MRAKGLLRVAWALPIALLALLASRAPAGAHCCVCLECDVEGMCTDDVENEIVCEQLCAGVGCPSTVFETESDCGAGCTVGGGVRGDCDGDGHVTVSDLIMAVTIALGMQELAACPSLDRNHDGLVTVDELIGAVNAALAS